MASEPLRAWVNSNSLPALLQNRTWLDFDPRLNCTVAGQLFAQLQAHNYNYDEIFLHDLVSFVSRCAVFSLRNSRGVNVTAGQIVDFYRRNREVSRGTLFHLNEAIPIHEACHSEFCKSLQWEGNPDISGIGVLIAYIVQCIITSLFCAACVFLDLRARLNHRFYSVAGDTPHHPRVHRSTQWMYGSTTSPKIKAFRESLEMFWLSSSYFGFGIIVAGLVVNSTAGPSEHTLLFSLFAAQLSTTSLICLRFWYRPTHSCIADTWLVHLGVSLFAWAVGIRVRDSDQTTAWERYCFRPLPSYSWTTGFVYLSIAILPFYLFIAICIRYCKHRRLRWRSLHYVRAAWEIFIPLSSFLLMWTSLWLFIQLRWEIISVVGDAYTDNVWGFGQILAVLALFPMLVEIGKAYLWGTIKATILPPLSRWIPKGKSKQSYQAKQSYQVVAGYHENDAEMALVSIPSTPALRDPRLGRSRAKSI